MLLRARQFEFRFPRPALVMGIVNVTPDSFSDGGRFLDVDAAIEHAERLVLEGADILDIGGESTRPGAVPVPESEELARVIPVVKVLAGRVSVPISIDSRKPAVARAALAAGASLVNDVGSYRRISAMLEAVAAYGAGYICTHSQGDPETMQDHPLYKDVVAEVGRFFDERLAALPFHGVSLEQVVLDPGVGFGKTLEHNLLLLGGMGQFVRRHRPVMVGVSRKSFLGAVCGAKADERLPASLACAVLAVQAGAQMVRVHDVAATVQALRMTRAVMNQQSHVA